MIRFTHITENIKTVFKRFPVTMISAIIGSVTAIIITHNPWPGLRPEDFLTQIVMTAFLGFVLFVGIQLLLERIKKIKTEKRY